MKLGEISVDSLSGTKNQIVVFANPKEATKSIMVIDKSGDAYITLNQKEQQQLIDLLTQVVQADR